MKKTVKLVAMLTLALALMLPQLACAEPDEAVKGIYDALTAEDSGYSQIKAMYADFEPDAAFEETLEDDGFTLSVSGSEYMSGSWTYTREGDYLVTAMGSEDFAGYTFIMQVISAVGAYYGMDAGLMNGYIAGLNSMELPNDCFVMEEDEAAGTTTVKINIAGPWDMAELDQMVLTEAGMSFDPLTEEYGSRAANSGKITLIANGNVDDLTMLISEYGGLDELAYTSIINAVNVLKPAGWEDFVAGYTELADAEGSGYSVALNVDTEAVSEIIDEIPEGCEFAIVRFGKGE